jgi:hypothetical protein
MGTLVFAFCGFFVSGADAKLYNNASQVVLLRHGNRTVMTMSNNYKGPTEDFAMVVPVPVVLQKEQVKTLAPNVFDHIDQLSAPRLVEYWERDPCEPEAYPEEKVMKKGKVAGAPRREAAGDAELGVKIEAKFEVGEYQILILSAKEAGGLDTWLHQHKYKIPEGAAGALAPYIREQMKFFVAKVNIQKVKHDENGLVVLSPLRFDFEASELRLPVRLGLLNAESKQDLIVYVLSQNSRYEVANYRTVAIPTNLDVLDEVRHSFAQFYAELFDATLKQYGGRAVVTEYAWDTGSCDPCPTPPLGPSEIATLGGDVAFGMGQQEKEEPVFRGRRPGGGGFMRMILTRLHTRYDKQTLSDDLVFKEAPPMMGGREGVQQTVVGQGAYANNFQARYIIRHYWQGKVACEHPVWGRWGGPPGTPAWQTSQPPAAAARNLANTPRGKVTLKKVVATPVPGLGLAGIHRPEHK